MKNPAFFLFILIVLFISSCASRPRLMGDVKHPEIMPPPVERPIAVPSTEKKAETKQETMPEIITGKIKRNGNDIKKNFTVDDSGRILVKADFQEGERSFVVYYDLENAEVLADSSYELHFSVFEKEPETIAETEAVETTVTEKLFEEGTLIWKPEPGSAGLLLAMDDDHIKAWEENFDLFDKYGCRLTFFIQGEFNPFCVKALERGHDVGFHSLSHLDLRKVSQEAFQKETVAPLKSYRKEGVPLASFAFPFGFSEPWMHEILLEHFGVLRGYGTTFRLYSENQIRSGFVTSRAIDNTVIPGEEDFDRIITSMLMTVKFLDDGRILSLTTHNISATASWGISPRRLEFLLKTAVDLKLKFYRYSDFVN